MGSPISRPESGPQASVVSQQYSRRVVVARRASLRGGQSIEGNGPLTTDSTSYLSLELAPLTLKMRDGSAIVVDFESKRDSLIDERSAWRLLASVPVMLTSEIDSIVVCGGAEAYAPLALSGNEIGMAFDVMDADAGTFLKRIGMERVFDADSAVSFVCEDRLAGLAGKRVYLRPSVRGFEKRGRGLVSTLVHVYTVLEDSVSKPTAPIAKGSNASALLPTTYELHQNYPNPFNPTTEIQFDLPEAGNVSLVVYDVLGRKVVDLVNGYQEAGYRSVKWNASGQASGVYFARFSVTNASGAVAYTKVSKLMLVR